MGLSRGYRGQTHRQPQSLRAGVRADGIVDRIDSELVQCRRPFFTGLLQPIEGLIPLLKAEPDGSEVERRNAAALRTCREIVENGVRLAGGASACQGIGQGRKHTSISAARGETRLQCGDRMVEVSLFDFETRPPVQASAKTGRQLLGLAPRCL